MNEPRDDKVVYLRLDDIIPNRFQPREIFDESGLQELSDSIKEHGVIQPVIVRPLGDKYELIAGERRTKASAIAGLTTIPAIVRNMDDKESAKVSLLENLQRKNLSAIEEARTYKRILELDNMTQEDLARNLGRSQPMVANKLRLLALPEEIQEALMRNQISERHARSLLTIKNKKDQLEFLDRIRNERLTVRELDKELKKFKENNNQEINEEQIKEDKERDFMNNNIGNFGGMGLNDYQSGINNNMFNNIPNNFNNMSNVDNSGNQINYNEFNGTQNNDNNQIDSYNDNTSTNNQELNNNQFNSSSSNSLGSMFDNYNNAPENYQTDSNDNSNVFISHIREDNLPKVDNQFLPNFDNFNSNNFDNDNNDSADDGTREALNNFNQNNNYNEISEQNNFDMGTNFNTMNNQDTFNNNYNSFNSNMMNQPQNNFNTFNQDSFGMNNQSNMMNNSFNGNNGFNNGNNFDINNNYNNGFNNNYGNSMPNMNQEFNNNYNMNGNFNQNVNDNYLMNNFNNSYMNNQPNMMNNGINPNMNQMGNNYGTNNMGNVGYNGMVPEYSDAVRMNQGIFGQNQGGMFEQPLNIVDVPRNNPLPSPNNEMNNYQNNYVSPIQDDKRIDNSGNNFQENNDNYEDILFNKPVPMANDELEEKELNTEIEPISPNPVENDMNAMEQVDQVAPISDIEVIDESDEKENSPEVKEENSVANINNEYISLDPVNTINSTMDAVMELKKTTDKIKQNHIDIETEEIDFDDVYQITIKIKKTDTL